MIMLNELKLSDRNLLENWYIENVFRESEQSIVEFVYHTLKGYFGKQYFFVKAGTDKPLEKICWIFGLLSLYEKRSALYALADICNLIKYMHTQAPELLKDVEGLKNNPMKLRSFFYELFIYRLLDENRIVNQKLVDDDGQELEGTCELNGRTFLFECRKVFMPDLDLLDMMRRLMEGVILSIKSTKPVAPNIYQFRFNRPISGNQLAGIIKKFDNFITKEDNRDAAVEKEICDECSLGSLKIEPYTESLFMQIKKEKKYDVLCVFPEAEILEKSQIHGRFGLFANFEVAHSKIYKKLENVLRKKHRQHRNSVYHNQIIFIDSESLSEFQMGVFQHDHIFDLERIKNLHRKLRMTEIICITRKEFTEREGILAVDVITPESEEQMEKIIKELFRPMFNKSMRFG